MQRVSVGIPAPAREPVSVAGQWDIAIRFVYGIGEYAASFEQDGEKLRGTYRGRFIEGELEGTLRESSIRFRGRLRIEGTWLVYEHEGAVDGDTMKGTVRLGEYGEASWSASRRKGS